MGESNTQGEAEVAGTVQPGEQGSRKDLINAYKYLMRGMKKAEAGSSRWHAVKSKEAMDTD